MWCFRVYWFGAFILFLGGSYPSWSSMVLFRFQAWLSGWLRMLFISSSDAFTSWYENEFLEDNGGIGPQVGYRILCKQLLIVKFSSTLLFSRQVNMLFPSMWEAQILAIGANSWAKFLGMNPVHLLRLVQLLWLYSPPILSILVIFSVIASWSVFWKSSVSETVVTLFLMVK